MSLPSTSSLGVSPSALLSARQSAETQRANAVLSRLRALSGSTGGNPKAGNLSPAEQQKEVAKALEGLFVRQMIKVMRKTAGQSSLFGKSTGQAIFNDMLSGAIADQISGSGGFGLARQLHATLDAGKKDWTQDGLAALGLSAKQPATPATPATPPKAAAAADKVVVTQPVPRADIIEQKAPDAQKAVEQKKDLSASGPLGRSLSSQDGALAVHQLRGRRVLAGLKNEPRTLGNVAFEAPNRRRAQPIIDRDGRLANPLPDMQAFEIDANGRVQGSANQQVVAAFSGKVVGVSNTRIVLERGDGTRLIYAGIKPAAQLGDLFLRGQTLGRVGAQPMALGASNRNGTMKPSEIKALIFPSGLAKGK
jgi:Rod binding domain-containing protein